MAKNSGCNFLQVSLLYAGSYGTKTCVSPENVNKRKFKSYQRPANAGANANIADGTLWSSSSIGYKFDCNGK